MKSYLSTSLVLLLVLLLPKFLWAIEPDTELFAQNKTERDARYRDQASQLTAQLGSSTDEKEKQNLQLQLQLLSKLQELPKELKEFTLEEQFAYPDGDGKVTWEVYQQFLNRYIQIQLEETVAKEDLDATRKKQQELHNTLIGLDEQNSEKDILQLQHAYQVLRTDQQSQITKQLALALQRAKELFPKLLGRVTLQPDAASKQNTALEAENKKLQQLKEKLKFNIAGYDALIEQQESIIGGYLGRELSDTDKRLLHFEKVKLLQQQVRRLEAELKAVEAEINLYGQHQLANWFTLLGSKPEFFTLTDSSGDIDTRLAKAKEQITNLHSAVYGYEKELSSLRGTNALTGPKAKELIGKLEEEIRKVFTNLSGMGQKTDIFKIQGQLLNKAIHLRQSAIGSMVIKTRDATDNFLEHVLSALKYPLLSYSGMQVSLLLLLQVISLLLFGIASSRLFSFLVQRIGIKREWSERTVQLIQAGGKYPLIIVFSVIILSVIGINTSSLTIIAGALSLGIGFGMQTIVNNLVSGIILLFDKSIRPGDFISLDKHLQPGGFNGDVVQMNIRTTVLRTNDNINIIIPNADLIASQVINWTYSDERVRFRIPFSVAYSTDINKMKRVVKDALTAVTVVLPHPEPQIWMARHGESSLDFIAAIWVEGESARQPADTMDAALTTIYQTLLEYDIEIPSPQVDLRFRDTAPHNSVIAPRHPAVEEMFPEVSGRPTNTMAYQQ